MAYRISWIREFFLLDGVQPLDKTVDGFLKAGGAAKEYGPHPSKTTPSR